MTTQHTLFPADTNAAPPREHRELTTADIDKVRQIEGFPIATDEAIIALSDPPHYTACPNPFLADFIAEHGTPYDAATDDYHREPFAADVSEGKNDPIYNAHSYHTKVPHKAIMRYILHYTNPGDIVFDGFCGTGMTGVAAQLCGDRAAVESLGYRVDRDGTIYEGEQAISKLGARKAVLSDLSPAATFIAYNYNTPVDVAAFEREAKRILAEVEAECGWMYETTHTDGRKGRINYTVWSEVFNCHNCSQEIVFLEGALDQESGEVSRAFNCPHCGVGVSKRSMTRAFESFYDLLNGLSCQRVKRVPVLINYTYKGKRYEKKADISDVELVKKIDQTSIQHFFPTIEMPFMHVTHIKDKMSNFGISHFSHFFLNRPQHALSTAWYAANKSQHLRTKQAMLFLVEQCFWTMTILNRYRPTGYSQTNQYMSGVYFIPSQSSEISPWYILDGKLQRLIKLFKTLPVKDNRVAVSLNSGGETPLPESTVDYIFTDPPFGENLQYSELNWFIESFYQVL